MSLILPKGFVVNSREIGGVVERINAEPLDLTEIARLWRVYNTTRRRLLDPTAERLENYWWRIWGSQLKGATVAKLFLDISDGDSFVPLRSHANRDEGTQSENVVSRYGPEVAGTVNVQRPFKSRPNTTSSSTLRNVPVVAKPNSILKKAGGPSTTGPRPNAHFDAPHESKTETSTNSSIVLQSHNLHLVQPPSSNSQTSKTEKKAEGGRGRKNYFAVSTAARKNKPASRRQGSQPSTNTAAKSSNQNKIQTSAKTVLRGFSEVPPSKKEFPLIRQENFSPGPIAPQSFKNRRCPKSAEINEVAWKAEESMPGAIALGEPGPDGLDELELRQKEANVCVKNQNQTSQNIPNGDLLVLQKSIPSIPEGSQEEGQPHLSDSTIPAYPQVTSTKDEDQCKGEDTEDINQVPVFAKIPVPLISAHNSAGSLAGKSQLTLLLNKNRAKNGI